jgi:hypothetical protein
MTKRKKSPPPKRPWTPLAKSEPRPNPKARDLDPTFYDKCQAEFASGQMTLYANDHVVVHLRVLDDAGRDGWVHLSIRHHNRSAIRDWRMFQRIKNELMGDDREAIELYPAESRMVDEANSYHLWVAPKGVTFPVGFDEGRLVGDSAQARAVGARQRDFDMPTSPTSSEQENEQ